MAAHENWRELYLVDDILQAAYAEFTKEDWYSQLDWPWIYQKMGIQKANFRRHGHSAKQKSGMVK